MKYELFDFQKEAVGQLLKKMQAMLRSYEEDGSLSAVSLTAPTGSGKTVISAAVAEGLFYGNDTFPGDDHAVILWLSDSPSLNEQTMKRFDKATDLLNSATTMEAVGPDFAKNHRKLIPGHVYFLNRQLLSAKGKLANEAEGGRTFYDVLSDTIEDADMHLFLFIDEAHRGLGKDATSDSANKTIYAKLIDGQPGKNPPMPIVVGISATPERFDAAMKGRKNRDMKAPINVPVSAVRASGLIKDTIELRTPKTAANTKHQDLTQACIKLTKATKLWNAYCKEHDISPIVIPLLVVQVEDKVSTETLDQLCSQIHKTLPWLDISTCFANVFGEHEDITIPSGKIPYCAPDDVADQTEIRILFAKDAVSTGWDCPRAEVIYSRRKRTDPTYIAQLIGRMIRTPLARRIDSMEELNTVACYLPEYDAETVESVIERLKADNIAVATANIIKNPADVEWFGNRKERIEKVLQQRQGIQSTAHGISTMNASGTSPAGKSLSEGTTSYGNTEYSSSTEDFPVNIDDETFDVDAVEDVDASTEELQEVLKRLPQVDDAALKASFEGIITRQVRHNKPNVFLDLWDLIDIITSDINPNSDIGQRLEENFYNNIEGEILKHPAEFKRSFNEIRNTTVSVKRVDPLTGEEFEDHEELVENDAERLVSYYRQAINIFAGASDLIKFYINKRCTEELESDSSAISRISAVAACVEIVQALETWAEKYLNDLLSEYGPDRYAVSEAKKAVWDRIEGNTLPYIERTLNIRSGTPRQNKEYDKYPRHIFNDDEGWAYLNLNDLEKKIVKTELNHPLNVAWYRNQPRNLNASLCIPYYLNGEWENMYPDFIFFQKTAGGSIIRKIVDPHGDWLGDSVAKLKGYVFYLKDHPEMFGSVQAVADEKNGECRYLDLMRVDVQKAVEKFTGSSAKELFNGPLSRPYKLNLNE